MSFKIATPKQPAAGAKPKTPSLVKPKSFHATAVAKMINKGKGK